MREKHPSGSYLARALREKYLLKENNLSQGPHGKLVKRIPKVSTKIYGF